MLAMQAQNRAVHKLSLSVVVVVYNIPREAPRTLRSLAADYQRNVDPDDYEVIVVDNGSSPAVSRDAIAKLPGNFRLIRIEEASPSPAQAVNRGLEEARGEIVGVMVDGARIATPGLLHFARHGACLFDTAVVVTPGWYLGHDFQRWAIRAGYDQTREDGLLATIGWPEDGYRLFEIGTPDESSLGLGLQPVAESNALFLMRRTWELLGGFDERFASPGGGLVNHDILRRAIELPNAELVILLGEGTFHQLHGGIATNAPVEEAGDKWSEWVKQYQSICGRPYAWPRSHKPPIFIGSLPRPALAHFTRAAIEPVPRELVETSEQQADPPLGQKFDRGLWALAPPVRPIDSAVARVIDLAHSEFRAGRYMTAATIARLARERAPREPEPMRLLSLLAPWPPQPWRAEYHLAIAEAHRLLGKTQAATSAYRTALGFNGNLIQAHMGLASMQMPGSNHYDWLERLYAALAPKFILETGIDDGQSLARVRPPTIAIGIDPNPKVAHPLEAETHIFAEGSDAFFARGGPKPLLRGEPLGIGFINGPRLYEQALKDFINLERYCGPQSVILFHNTIPLDEPTQRRTQLTDFHTGDVWKVIPCLKYYRPDLDVFTIATPLTGLTAVTGLNPSSGVLGERYHEVVARFVGTPFSEIENCMKAILNIMPNDWEFVRKRLFRSSSEAMNEGQIGAD